MPESVAGLILDPAVTESTATPEPAPRARTGFGPNSQGVRRMNRTDEMQREIQALRPNLNSNSPI